MLHKLAIAAESSSRQENTESVDYITQKLFNACRKGLQFDVDYFKKGIALEVPLLQDLQG